MEYTIRTIPKYRLAYGLLPYKRNQDVIKIHKFGGGDYCLAVADGWNGQDIFSNDEPGREVSYLVATEFPKMYLTYGLRACLES